MRTNGLKLISAKKFDELFSSTLSEYYDLFSLSSSEFENIEFEAGSFKLTTAVQETLESQTEVLTQACQADTQLAKEVFTNNFLRLIYQSDFEFGYATLADEYVEKALKDYGPFARDWISDIFLKNFSRFSVIIGILRVISHIDYNLMRPQGMIMATAALRHENLEVIECGVRCFENWEAPENIDILKSVRFDQEWLNNYAQDVIKDLESLA